MRLATRMKITYGMFFLIPIVLIVVSFWGIGRIELRALQQKYDMEEGSVEMLFNPFEMLGNISVSVVEPGTEPNVASGLSCRAVEARNFNTSGLLASSVPSASLAPSRLSFTPGSAPSSMPISKL